MKRTSSIILIGALLLCLCSCGKNAVWTPTGHAFFKESVQHLPDTIDTENVDFPEQRTGTFQKQSLPLTLTAVTDDACGEYETEDGSYLFRWDQTDHLRMLAVKDIEAIREVENMSKQELIAWIQKLVNRYYRLDWSEYQLECITNILGGEIFRQTYEDFVPPTEAGEQASYTFRFSKYIGQTKTGDSVTVFLGNFDVDGFQTEYPPVNYLIIHFPDCAFDEIESLSVDKAAADLAKDTFLKEHVKNYAYHEVMDSWAEIYHDKLYYVYDLGVFATPDGKPEDRFSIGRQYLYIELTQP